MSPTHVPWGAEWVAGEHLGAEEDMIELAAVPPLR